MFRTINANLREKLPLRKFFYLTLKHYTDVTEEGINLSLFKRD